MKAEVLPNLRKWAAAAAARGKSAATAAAASGNRLKEAATALISVPRSAAEERWQFLIGLGLNFTAIGRESSKKSENIKKEDKMTELVNEVREMKEGIRTGLEKLSDGKEAELKIMKEKENNTWIGKLWR